MKFLLIILVVANVDNFLIETGDVITREIVNSYQTEADCRRRGEAYTDTTRALVAEHADVVAICMKIDSGQESTLGLPDRMGW